MFGESDNINQGQSPTTPQVRTLVLLWDSGEVGCWKERSLHNRVNGRWWLLLETSKIKYQDSLVCQIQRDGGSILHSCDMISFYDLRPLDGIIDANGYFSMSKNIGTC